MSNLFFDLPTKAKKEKIHRSSTSGTAPKKKSKGIVLTCDECGLHKTCHSPKMPMSGEGKKKILVIAEAPGKDEDREGTQLIGRSGQLLRDVLDGFELDLDIDFWKTNAVICRPPDNRTPTNAEINACRKHLLQTIEETKPIGIIVLGAVAWDSLMGQRLSGRIKGKEFSSWVGEAIPDQETKTWIFPTYHPSYVLRMENDPVVKMVWKTHLKNACYIAINEKVPEYKYEDRVEVITDEQRAVEVLNSIEIERDIVAFDYETTGLKPHKEGQKIVCVSFSDGNEAWAFPIFEGKQFRDKLSDVLQSESVKKIAHNARFEGSWTDTFFGYPLQGLGWDTEIVAHCLASSKPTQLKWQTYVNFGVLGVLVVKKNI